jgi:tetratricopeptide (TPR) repeat protein
MAGGPSTARGMNFQASYAVFRALRAMQRYLASPTINAIIQPEARVGPEGHATQWDLSVSDPEDVVEIKVNPTGKDVTDFLERVRVAEEHAKEKRNYVFVYSKPNGILLDSLHRLRRTAEESRGDLSEFDRLRGLKEIPKAAELLAHIGTGSEELLCRIQLVNLPEISLNELLENHAITLAGNGAHLLIDVLFSELARAAAGRIGFSAAELLEIARTKGLEVQPVTKYGLGSEETDFNDLLSVLRSAPDGLPLDVLGQSIHQAPSAAEGMLNALAEQRLVSVSEDRWKVAPFPINVSASSPDVIASALRAVLNWIRSRKSQPISRADIECALTLANLIVAARPEAVARTFITLHQPLKRLGDKHLVLAAANLAIDAARADKLRPNEVIEGEAQALICGRSWVFQRIGRLDEARAAAATSQRLGEDICWDLNTAFCEKCIGRLCRIEAESHEDRAKSADLLQDSINHLKRAVEAFTGLGLMPEVGDCYSLLGRTYLVAGNLKDAAAAAEKAEELITDLDSKDYFDLLILRGDLATKREVFEAAEAHYTDAIKLQAACDFEKSEILARAHFQRGKLFGIQKKNAFAAADFRKAASIWHRLDEPETEAKSEWEELRLLSTLPRELLTAIQNERVTVRVRAVKIYQERMGATSRTGTPKRLKAPGPSFWSELIKDARQLAASESREW